MVAYSKYEYVVRRADFPAEPFLAEYRLQTVQSVYRSHGFWHLSISLCRSRACFAGYELYYSCISNSCVCNYYNIDVTISQEELTLLPLYPNKSWGIGENGIEK